MWITTARKTKVVDNSVRMLKNPPKKIDSEITNNLQRLKVLQEAIPQDTNRSSAVRI